VRIVYLIISVVILSTAFIGYSEAKEHDGKFWTDMNSHEKVLYISGWMDSGFVVSYYTKIVKETFNDKKSKYTKKFSSMDEAQRKKSEEWQIEMTNLTILYYEQKKLELLKNRIILDTEPGTVICGVNTFYDDYKNRKIPVPWAIYYVLESIRGKSEKLMQSYLEKMRQVTSSGSYPLYAPDIDQAK